ncbi:MAG: hypothetical protein PHP86_03605 [Nevskiales bacterium]|nr:hypothetical protein [Nevskiales bacterium]
MDQRTSMGAKDGHQLREIWRGLRAATVGAAIGAAGLTMWMLMHLPLGPRLRSSSVATMAACFGLATAGQPVRVAQPVGTRRR